MKKSIFLLGIAVLCVSLVITVNGNFLVQNKSDATHAQLQTYGESETVSTTSNPLGNIIGSFVDDNQQIGDKVSNIAGGISGGIEGVGQLASGLGEGALEGLAPQPGLGFGGETTNSSGGLLDIFGDLFSGGQAAGTTAPANIAETENVLHTIAPAVTVGDATTAATQPVTQPSTESESFDAAVTANPYTKPAKEFKAGDKDESIKWLQWIFVKTGYGLDESGITGEMDDATVKLIEKFQKERGLTVSGGIDSALVSEAEIYYLEKFFGASSPSANVSVSNVQHSGSYNVTEGENRDAPIASFIIAVAAIWIVAVSVIFIMFFVKKKKLSGTDKPNADEKKSDGQSDSSSGISSMSDLFEETK